MRKFIIDSISNPDDKIATDLCSKSTIENRIAIGVISATSPELIFAAQYLNIKSYMLWLR